MLAQEEPYTSYHQMQPQEVTLRMLHSMVALSRITMLLLAEHFLFHLKKQRNLGKSALLIHLNFKKLPSQLILSFLNTTLQHKVCSKSRYSLGVFFIQTCLFIKNERVSGLDKFLSDVFDRCVIW